MPGPCACNHFDASQGNVTIARWLGIGMTATQSPVHAIHVLAPNPDVALDNTLGGGRRYSLTSLTATDPPTIGFVLRDESNTSDPFRLFVDSEGRLGVNTVRPAHLLHAVSRPGVGADLALTNVTSGRAFSLVNAGISGTDTSAGLGVYDLNASRYRLFVRANGNVGIGTATPEAPLEVGDWSAPFATDGIVRLSTTNAAGGLRRWELGTSWRDGWGFVVRDLGDAEAAARPFLAIRGGTGISTGNVGIGVLYPEARLEVHGAPNQNETITMVVRGTSGLGSLNLEDATGARAMSLFSYTAAQQNLTRLKSAGDLTLHAGNAVHDGTNEWVRVTTEGNVRLATTESRARLNVHRPADNPMTIAMVAPGAVGSLNLLGADGLSSFALFADTSNSHTRLKSRGPLSLHTNAAEGYGGENERVHINVNGDVGIGVAPGVGNKLDVNGNIHTHGMTSNGRVYVGGSGQAGHVSAREFHAIKSTTGTTKIADEAACYYA
jgi:hypothetical protein